MKKKFFNFGLNIPLVIPDFDKTLNEEKNIVFK